MAAGCQLLTAVCCLRSCCLSFFWAFFGPVLGDPSCLSLLLAHLGPSRRLSWTIFAPFWASLGPSWSPLGPSRRHLEPSWPKARKRPQKGPENPAGSNRFWEPFLGPFWELFRVPFLNTFFAILGSLLGSILAPKSAPGVPRQPLKAHEEVQRWSNSYFEKPQKSLIF